MRSLRKIPTRLRGTNFCTRSSRFAPSFVRQPNDPECTQIVRNAPKRQFRLQWGRSGAFVAKIPTQLHGTNFCTSSARFAPSFVKATKRSRMHPNGKKHTKTSIEGPMDWIGGVCCKKFRRDFVARTFALVRPFCTEFSKASKRSQMHQIVRNSPKHQFRI